LLAFLVGVLVLLAGGAVAMVVRYRRAPGVEREQIKWVLFGFFVFAMSWVIAFVLESWGSGIVGLLLVLGISVIPTVITIAVLRFRLYDIDVVISKTVTYGVLAGFITVVYAVIVVGVGSLLGGGDEPNLALSIVAVAVVAVVFEPVRSRVQHWANVVVYGKRATPYEVLASATARLSDTGDPNDALARVAELVAEGTGAVEAVLWLKVGDVMYPRASSPEGAMSGLGPVSGGEQVAGVPGDRVVAVRHRGDVLGALSITKGRADAVTGSDEKVLDDVAAGAGVLLRNLRLNAELAERADELRRSRRRLVAAHDAERRRLERDLHDGAQQQVVALKVKLGIARTLAEREGAESVADLVSSLSDTTQEAVDGMRAVAHGIYPPLLEAEGLEAALNAARRTVPIPVEVVTSGPSRYGRSVEESVYFSVLDTVRRGVDEGATRAVVTLGGDGLSISFRVDLDADLADLTAVVDRVDALDGTVAITSEPGRSVIDGDIPVAPAVVQHG
jgi:signal transduction histidine kinase